MKGKERKQGGERAGEERRVGSLGFIFIKGISSRLLTEGKANCSRRNRITQINEKKRISRVMCINIKAVYRWEHSHLCSDPQSGVRRKEGGHFGAIFIYIFCCFVRAHKPGSLLTQSWPIKLHPTPTTHTHTHSHPIAHISCRVLLTEDTMLSLMPNPQQHRDTGRLTTQIEHFDAACEARTLPIRNLNDAFFVPVAVHVGEMEHGIVGGIYFMF